VREDADRLREIMGRSQAVWDLDGIAARHEGASGASPARAGVSPLPSP
jgi:hypothetical protein